MEVIGGTSLSTLVGFLNQLQTVSYVNIASATLLVHDYLLTFPSEVEYIWPSRFNLAKLLFFLTRYSPFVDALLVIYYDAQQNLDPQSCLTIFKAIAWLQFVGIGIAEFILVLRTVAIWQNKRSILVSLSALFVASIVAGAFVLQMWLSMETFQSVVFNGVQIVPLCYPIPGSNILYVDFLAIIVFESVILVLTIIKGVEHLRHTHAPFLHVLYRDGILFYFVFAAMSLANVIVIVFSSPTTSRLQDLIAMLHRDISSICTARVLLHIRAAYKEQEAGQANISTALSFIRRNSGQIVAPTDNRPSPEDATTLNETPQQTEV